MPVEIKELVIRAVVDAGSERGACGGCAEAGASVALGGEQQDAVVEAAVKEVLRILRTARER